jgi:hypothetical protein
MQPSRGCELPDLSCTCRLEGSHYMTGKGSSSDPAMMEVHPNASILLVSTAAQSMSLTSAGDGVG